MLASQNLNWLTTEAEKAAFFASVMPPMAADGAQEAGGDDTGPRPVIHASHTLLPIGVHPTGRAVFFYLATVPWTEEFRRFLQRLTPVLRLTRAWTLRLVFPRPIDQQYSAYQTVIREELETPLQPAAVRELKAHFERRRAAADLLTRFARHESCSRSTHSLRPHARRRH